MATAARKPVLHLLDALLRGGAERLAVELAVRADRGRFDPAVACFRQEAFGEELAAAGRRVHVVPKRRAFDLRLLFALVRLLRREGVALVHAHDLQSATYGTLAAKWTRRPVLLTVHGVRIFQQRRAATLLPRLGRWMDRVVFVGHWLQRVAADEYRVRPRRPVVVHNGVDTEAFRPGDPDPSLDAELRLPPGAPVVGTVGNLRPVKDYPCLLRAFAHARSRLASAAGEDSRLRLPDSQARTGVSPGVAASSIGNRQSAIGNPMLVLVGDGAERPGLEALASELGVAESVRFAGARTDVARLLRRFDVFALSSQTEGISVALLEAMATGLPAVATDTGGNPEVVAEGQTGHLIPVGDPERFGEALAGLLADPARRRTWGQAARARVEAEFSLDRMVRQYEAIYDELTRRR